MTTSRLAIVVILAYAGLLAGPFWWPPLCRWVRRKTERTRSKSIPVVWDEE